MLHHIVSLVEEQHPQSVEILVFPRGPRGSLPSGTWLMLCGALHLVHQMPTLDEILPCRAQGTSSGCPAKFARRIEDGTAMAGFSLNPSTL